MALISTNMSHLHTCNLITQVRNKVSITLLLDTSAATMLPTTGTLYDPAEKIWSGPIIKDLYNIEMTVAEAILRELQKYPQKIIQIMDSTGEALTAQQFVNYSKILAINLMKMKIGRQDIVGLYAHNTTHVPTVMMASFLVGAPVNALFPGFDKENVILLYKDTRPKIIFCDVENFANAQQANEELQLQAKIVIMNGHVEGVSDIENLLIADDSTELDKFIFPCAHMTGKDTAVILCSSGTTGTPKGVTCSHQALLNKRVYLSLTPDAVLLCFSTMYWASGLINLVDSLLCSTLRIQTDKPYSPQYLLYLVKRYKITHLLTSSNHMAELVLHHNPDNIRESLQSIKMIVCGGSKVPLMVQEKLLNVLPAKNQQPGFSIIYGMSEIAGGVSLNAGPPFEFHKGSEGKLLPNHQVCIMDKNGQLLGPMESGEILIYNPYTWLGYFKNAQATAATLCGKWLRSGDIGFFDKQGFLHVCGRDKEMFKYKGFQISPQLIEDVILRVPGVAEVCVFPQPDLIAENVIACAIVRKQDKDGSQLTQEMVLNYVINNLNSLYHLRGGVRFVDEMPRTSSGKILRQKVMELLNGSGDDKIDVR